MSLSHRYGAPAYRCAVQLVQPFIYAHYRRIFLASSHHHRKHYASQRRLFLIRGENKIKRKTRHFKFIGIYNVKTSRSVFFYDLFCHLLPMRAALAAGSFQITYFLYCTPYRQIFQVLFMNFCGIGHSLRHFSADTINFGEKTLNQSLFPIALIIYFRTFRLFSLPPLQDSRT